MSDPIMVPCEGSDRPTALGPTSREGFCKMCGCIVDITGPDGKAKWHQRKDVHAMVERGDFEVVWVRDTGDTT